MNRSIAMVLDRAWALALFAILIAPPAARAQVDSVAVWTAQLQTGSVEEKVSAASHLAGGDVSLLPPATLQAATDALIELNEPGPLPGSDGLSSEDMGEYHIDLAILTQAAGTLEARLALVPSVGVTRSIQWDVAALGDTAVAPLAEMVTEDRDAVPALGTLGLLWYWADSTGVQLSPQSRATIVALLTDGVESTDYSVRLGLAAALGNTEDAAFLPLAQAFEDLVSGTEPVVAGALARYATPPLEARQASASSEELALGTARVLAALCLGASGGLTDLCDAMQAAMDAATLALQGGDTGGAAFQLDLVQQAADSAYALGYFTTGQHALASGGAAQAVGRTSLDVTADTYLRRGSPNQNQGDEDILRIRSSGNNRALVAVDAAALSALSGPVSAAYLELDIVFNANNWGNDGRTVDAHRMLVPWTHFGATWNCADDLDPDDQSPDCPTTEWEMRTLDPSPYETTPSGTVLITRDLLGPISIDVTDDVNAMLAGQVPSYGWIIRKTQEGQNGHIQLASSETGDGPRLVVVE